MVRRPVVGSKDAPVRDWYRWNASVGFREEYIVSVWIVFNTLLTRGDENQGSAGVDDTSSR